MIRQSGGSGSCLKRPAEKASANLTNEATFEERLASLEKRLDEVTKSIDTWCGRFAIALATLEKKIEQQTTQAEQKRH